MRGKAYIVCGSPAAGKSTYASQMAATKRAVLIDIDTCTEQIIQTALSVAGHNPDDRDSQYFKNYFREPIYQTLFSIALDNLSIMDVIIVGPFTKEIRDTNWPDKLKQILQTEVEIHYISCDAAKRKKRMQLRNNARDFLKLSNWEAHINYFSGEEAPAFPHLHIETD